MRTLNEFLTKLMEVELGEPTRIHLDFDDGEGPTPAIAIARTDPNGTLALDFYDRSLSSSAAIIAGTLATAIFQNGCTLNGHLQRLSFSMRNASKGRLILRNRELVISDSELRFAEFYIEDFPIFRGEGSTYDITTYSSDLPEYPGMRALGGLELKEDGWEIKIREVPDKDTSGITHSGIISRVGNVGFSSEELGNVLDGLLYFLSFITGVYREPAIVIGYDMRPQPVWGRISKFNQEKYHADNWFDKHHGSSIARLFPGFWRSFNDQTTKDKIRHCVKNYAESSIIGHIGLYERALVASYRSLEGLARWRLNVKNLNRRHIEKALRQCCIEIDLSAFPDLLRIWRMKYKSSGHSDSEAGLNFVRQLRNKSAHADFQVIDLDDCYDAWRLSQRYVELMLLSLCDYDGEYRNRVTAEWVGQVEPVPWAANAQQAGKAAAAGGGSSGHGR